MPSAVPTLVPGASLTEPSDGYKFIDEKKEHMHTYNGKPMKGVTTALKEVLGKGDALMQWAADCATVMAAEKAINQPGAMELYKAVRKITDQKERSIAMKKLESSIAWFKECRYAWREFRDSARDDGIDMHAELEAYVRTCLDAGLIMAYHGMNPKVKTFSVWAKDTLKCFVASEVHVYSVGLFVGGIVDCIGRMADGRLVIIDFKSSKEVYYDQLCQVGGYAWMFEENGAFDRNGKYLVNPEDVELLFVVPFGGDCKPVMHADVEGRKLDFGYINKLFDSKKAIYG